MQPPQPAVLSCPCAAAGRVLQEFVPLAIIGVAAQLVNLWIPVSDLMPSLQVRPPLQCLQAMVRLSSLITRAWPGPGLEHGWQGNSSAAAAAAETSRRGPTSPAHAYEYSALPLAVSCAAQLYQVLHREAFSIDHTGEPCSMALKQGLQTPVLEVLASADVQHVLLVGLLEAHLDSQPESPCVLQSCLTTPDQARSEPWHGSHEQLADALGLRDALPLLVMPLGRGRSAVTGLGLALMRAPLALSLCMAARQKLGSSSARCRDLPSNLHYALYLTVIEAMLLRPHKVAYVCVCPLLEELVVSVGE